MSIQWVGQTKFLASMANIVDKEYPKFSIITGMRGCGKKTIAHELASKLVGEVNIITLPSLAIADVRDVINTVYAQARPIAVIFQDADTMSIPAQNAILKLAEEPPEKCWIIMTANDEQNLLSTIRSRAVIFEMDRYTPDEIEEYLNRITDTSDKPYDYPQIFRDLCETPGEVNTLLAMDSKAFYEFVASVVDNIAEVNGSNAFKIADRIAIKGEADKYDLQLFLRAFAKVCAERMIEKLINRDTIEADLFAIGVRITSRFIKESRTASLNKQMLFDDWILKIREAWME